MMYFLEDRAAAAWAHGDCGRGITEMRILGIVALSAALAGCAALDRRLPLAWVINMWASTDRGSGIANTQFCKVSVIGFKAGVVSRLNTEDYNAGGGLGGALGMYGSICANRLGMERQSFRQNRRLVEPGLKVKAR